MLFMKHVLPRFESPTQPSSSVGARGRTYEYCELRP